MFYFWMLTLCCGELVGQHFGEINSFHFQSMIHKADLIYIQELFTSQLSGTINMRTMLLFNH